MKLCIKCSGICFLLLLLQDLAGGALIHYSKLMAGKSRASKGRTLKVPIINRPPVNMAKPKDFDKIMKKIEKENNRLKEGDFEEELPENAMPRGGTADITKRWNYKMTIVVDQSYPQEAKDTIGSALYVLSNAMECFKFRVLMNGEKINRKKDHLVIKNGGKGCYSVLGKSGGRQETVISPSCNLFGTTIHEIMHVLGFFHEHVRPDRDRFVDVNWNVLQTETKRHQYKIRDDQILYNDKYDFDSLMHYPLGSALQPKPGMMQPGDDPGQRNHLSEMDIIRLKGMYPCGENKIDFGTNSGEDEPEYDVP